MSPVVVEQSIDYLFRASPRRPHYYIYFFGGEPLLNLDGIEHAVRHARARAVEAGKTVEFGVTTNGTLLTKRAIETLIQEDFQICISMDGSAESHDANRPTKGGGGSHKHVLRGVEKIRKRLTRTNQLKIRATMSHQSHDPLEMASYFESIGIRRYGIGTTFERAGHPEPVNVTETDLAEMDETFDRMLSDIVTRLDAGTSLPRYNPFFRTVGSLTSGRRHASIGCGLCRNDQGIGTDGDIYPCHRYVGSKEYVIGNVRAGIDPVRLKAVYRQFFDMWQRHCRNCWARYTCSGACPWQHSDDSGMLRNPIEYQCNSIRRSIHRSAWLSAKLARDHPDLFHSIARTPASSGCCNPQ